jgi:hypothetical protein
MPLLYATADDLATFIESPTPPAGAERLIKGASALVRSATRAALYDTTSAGLPSDPDVAEAFKDATCAQAAEWARRGIDPASGVTPGRPQSSSIGGATVNWGTTGGMSDEDTLRELIPDAAWYLESAGLLSGPVQVWG